MGTSTGDATGFVIAYLLVSLGLLAFGIWWMIATYSQLKAIRDKIAPPLWGSSWAGADGSAPQSRLPGPSLTLYDVSPLPTYSGIEVYLVSKRWAMGAKQGQFYGVWDREAETEEPMERFAFDTAGQQDAQRVFIQAAGQYYSLYKG